MRPAILALGLLALAACNKGAETEEVEGNAATLTADRITANDVTAIDAVTGEAANMAEDVALTELPGNESGNAVGNSTGVAAPSARVRPRPAPAPESDDTPAEEPAGNSD